MTTIRARAAPTPRRAGKRLRWAPWKRSEAMVGSTPSGAQARILARRRWGGRLVLPGPSGPVDRRERQRQHRLPGRGVGLAGRRQATGALQGGERPRGREPERAVDRRRGRDRGEVLLQ